MGVFFFFDELEIREPETDKDTPYQVSEHVNISLSDPFVISSITWHLLQHDLFAPKRA